MHDARDAGQVAALKDSLQFGGELEVAINGTTTKQFSWQLNANLLQPLFSDTQIDPEGERLEGFDLMNIEFSAKASIALTSWAALDYVFIAKRLPLVLNDWQIHNGVLLNASLKIF